MTHQRLALMLVCSAFSPACRLLAGDPCAIDEECGDGQGCVAGFCVRNEAGDGEGEGEGETAVEWTGASSGDWSDPLNWSGGQVPPTDADIVFHGAGARNVTRSFLGAAGRTQRSLTFPEVSDEDITIQLDDDREPPSGREFRMLSHTGPATIRVEAGSLGNHTLTSASSDGIIVLESDLVIEHDGGGVLTLAAMRDVAGESPFSVTKRGTGTVVLSGSNRYGGPTTILSGTLMVLGIQTDPTGHLIVGGPGAATSPPPNGAPPLPGVPTLGGTGTLGGDVSIYGGDTPGTLAPGDLEGPGVLSLGGHDLTLEQGARLVFRLGTQSDGVQQVSTLKLTNQHWPDFVFVPGPGFDVGRYVLLVAETVTGDLGIQRSGDREFPERSFDGTLSIEGAMLVLTVTRSVVR